MNRALTIVTFAISGLFLIMGLLWLISPAFVGQRLGMELLQGTGLSTQIGDLSAFFITLGSCILAGVITQNKMWFYPAMMLLGFAAIGRILAWLFHGADLATDKIVVEAFLVGFLYFNSTKLAPRGN
ncbi:hypothetical protein [uncultured Umboniibacter sp.]|uniref:hypothetical protein n=1 Tax=uncultured Umboniibacter sp. TaxID=1798917 RepID=UPI002619F1F4|nr:hypothetical protein [uncultured Umboniibacter sp.]